MEEKEFELTVLKETYNAPDLLTFGTVEDLTGHYIPLDQTSADTAQFSTR